MCYFDTIYTEQGLHFLSGMLSFNEMVLEMRECKMTKMTFDKMPTEIEETTVEPIAKEKIQQAWQAYEAKPEYKTFNKHDLIESMIPVSEDRSVNHKK
jgi:hypothetical protein